MRREIGLFRGKMNNRGIGQNYEHIASSYLSDKGYKILFNNYYTKFGEIDIIAYKKGLYVFCEVKYRKSDKYGKPYEYVTDLKKDRLSRTVMAFLSKNPVNDSDLRFDIISINGGEITHIKDAFEIKKYISNF